MSEGIEPEAPAHLGLALSGGGTRAAAFHRGTLLGLRDLDLIPEIDRMSTVSGGSIFGAGWLAARAGGASDARFLDSLPAVLQEGFFWPAVRNARACLLALPSYTRTDRIAETFDERLLHGMRLSDLPARPRLCLNATVLNSAQVARFSNNGLSSLGIGSKSDDGDLPEYTGPRLSLAFATAASAAYPFGLAPVRLRSGDLNGATFTGPLEGLEEVLLADGGILEDMGVQTLLRSPRFGATHLIVSDADPRDVTWRPRAVRDRIGNLLTFALSTGTLNRVAGIMYAKENRSMRQLVGALSGWNRVLPRTILMLRVNQSWTHLLEHIPSPLLRSRMDDAGHRGTEIPRSAKGVEELMLACGVDLLQAREIYLRMGGDAAVGRANCIETTLDGLPPDAIELLAEHARWQVHATHAIFGPIPPRSARVHRLKPEEKGKPHGVAPGAAVPA
jgi:predicted acylesterase/phospholipase RssA